MARSASDATNIQTTALAGPDLKLNLITPCTSKHIKKYSPQKIRMVTETPGVYHQHVRPYILAQKEAGRMDWVYNILEGRKEQEDIIYRETRSGEYELGHDPEGFLLLPDMNWDRKTVASLRILGLVERRDLLSLRDLRKKDISWLKAMMNRMLDAVERTYGNQGVERDCLKVYMHCESLFPRPYWSEPMINPYQISLHITISTFTYSQRQWSLMQLKLWERLSLYRT